MTFAKEGLIFIITPFALSAALVTSTCVFGVEPRCLLLGLALLFLIISLFCLFFFRDPHINITKGENLVLSPCNGTVMQIHENEGENVIRVFLSIFNVHLQRSPVSGVVKSVEHKSGKFLMAMRPEAHLVNEQNIITIENENGIFTVVQIAGFLARRCVARIAEGDVLKQGDKIGLIKFSSQVDLHLPKNVQINVKKGDKVISAVTVFGEIK
jgi:phosphatidylserine decarboxylase